MALNASVTCRFPTFVEDNSHNTVIDIFTAAANSFLSVITVSGNTFVIFVIWKQSLHHVPYNILLCCLAFSDFVVGLVAQPSLVIYKVMEIEGGPSTTYCVARNVQVCSGWLTGGVSVYTLCAVSLDRYLALKLHLRYTAVVTVPRVIGAVVCIWLGGVAFIVLRFFIARRFWMIAASVLLLLAISLIVIFYANVFQIVRRHRRQIQARFQLAEHFHGKSVIEVARHKKSAVTMLYVLGVFILCYLPLVATITADITHGYTLGVKIAYDFSSTFLFLSSSVNPLLYCWRIREVRQAVSNILRRTWLTSFVKNGSQTPVNSKAFILLYIMHLRCFAAESQIPRRRHRVTGRVSGGLKRGGGGGGGAYFE